MDISYNGAAEDDIKQERQKNRTAQKRKKKQIEK